MILIGLGANLPSPRYGGPVDTCAAALAALERSGVRVRRRSRWYRSAPVPPSAQPWFINGVAEVETDLSAADLLAVLHRVERDFGRARRERNEPRVIDLDLLAYGEHVSDPDEVPRVPHPRLIERAFVVLPLAELAPAWRHPESGLRAAELALKLPPGQIVEAVE